MDLLVVLNGKLFIILCNEMGHVSEILIRKAMLANGYIYLLFIYFHIVL